MFVVMRNGRAAPKKERKKPTLPEAAMTLANQPSPTLMLKHKRVITLRVDAIGCQSGTNPYAGGFNNVTCIPDRLKEPKSIKKPSLIFVNSMADYLHSDVPDEFNDAIFQVVRECPKHQFQFLTKRSQRMAEYFAIRSVPDNAWIGVSVEDKRYGLPRVDDLRKVKAKNRFLSIEPLLEDLGDFDLTGINWVIVGGESVAKKYAARRMMPEWVDSIQRQCHAQGVAFFFKQWGNWHPDGTWSRNKDFNLLHGREWNEMPNIA